MIIYTHGNPIDIGKIVINGDVSDATKEYKKLTFKVVRESSYQEYIDYLKSIDYDINKIDHNDALKPTAKYYEVQAD